MKLPDKIKLIENYLKEKKGGKKSPKECKCVVSGLDKNILILTSMENFTFADKGFCKNDAVDAEISSKKYPAVIKELYSNYCYLEIPAKKIDIKINDNVTIIDVIDNSFLYKNMLNAYLEVFKKSKHKKLREFFIKIYSEEKLSSPIKLKSFQITPPSRQNPETFFNVNLDDAQKELVSACLNITSDENSLFYLGFGPPGCGKTATITELLIISSLLKVELNNFFCKETSITFGIFMFL